jgi:hypothetical protein
VKRYAVIWESGEESITNEQRDQLLAVNAIYKCDEHGLDDGAVIYHVSPDIKLENHYENGTGPFSILERGK